MGETYFRGVELNRDLVRGVAEFLGGDFLLNHRDLAVRVLERLEGDGTSALLFCANVLRRRFPPFEPMFSRNAGLSYAYAKSVVMGPWAEGEAAIATDSEYSLLYAREILKSRFPKGEEVLSGSCMGAYGYALHIVRGRWAPGEVAISRDPVVSWHYLDYLRDRPEFDSVDREVFSSVESKLLRLKGLKKYPEYARMTGRRLPDMLENRLMLEGGEFCQEYVEWIGQMERTISRWTLP